jgi:predicted nucleic acid-binding protein
MIALDTSAVISHLEGRKNFVASAAALVLAERQACLPPVVVSELLSDPDLPSNIAALIVALPSLPVTDGYWERAGRLRARLLAKGLKARLADTLIAQSCLDHDVSLVTADRDFRHFVAVGKLRLFTA